MFDESILKDEEQAIYRLRAIYKKYGYLPFKMSKFEEYDFYLRNKNYLPGDRLISFQDTDGKLMALKPDVTLSIIKHMRSAPGDKHKVYYNETVYRVAKSTGLFKEIMQTGLECMGAIDLYDVYEVVLLAAKSLAAMDREYTLNISHLGILSSFLEPLAERPDWQREAIACIEQKNRHDLLSLAASSNMERENIEGLLTLTELYGSSEQVLSKLEPLCRSALRREAFSQLSLLCRLLQKEDCHPRIRLDFSLSADMKYYSGIVIQGFLDGIFEPVLAGGRYDGLMKRMDKNAGAIGFAMYLDLLEGLSQPAGETDVDILLLYDESTGMDNLTATMTRLLKDHSVSAQIQIPKDLRYGRLWDLRKGGSHD